MKFWPIQTALKVGDWTIFALTMFERDEEAVKAGAESEAELSYGFEVPQGELADRHLDVQVQRKR